MQPRNDSKSFFHDFSLEAAFNSISTPTEACLYPNRQVVILADPNLLTLPLEALPIFQQDGIEAVTKDFSLCLLSQRLLRIQPRGNSVGLS